MAHPVVVRAAQGGAKRAWGSRWQRDAGREEELLVEAFQGIALQPLRHIVSNHLTAGEFTAAPVLAGVVHVVVVIGLRVALAPGVLPFPPGLEAPLIGLPFLDAHWNVFNTILPLP